MTAMTDAGEYVTRGWLRATRKALGLSTEQLASLIDVHPDTIRRRWEYGTDRIPEGVREEVDRIVRFTDDCVKTLQEAAERHDEPGIIVFTREADVPHEHIALKFGLDWWMNVAWHAQRDMPELVIGFPAEMRMLYNVDHGYDIHAESWSIGLYVQTTGHPLTIPTIG